MFRRKLFHTVASVCVILTLIAGLLPLTGSAAARSIQSGDLASGEIIGTPQTGVAGVSETTAQIMQRERSAVKPPIHVMPRFQMDRSGLRENPLSPNVAQWPSASKPTPDQPVMPFSPQTLGTSFTGATLADTGAFPPDTMGTVGPTQFIVAVNGRFRSFNKTTGVADGVLNADPDVFFASAMTPVVSPVVLNFTSDPHIRYDRLSGRWFIVMIDVPCTNATCTTTAANRMLIAMSDSATITGSTVWSFFYFVPDASNLADYPTPGIDANALYIGANMFSLSTGSFSYSSGFVVRKSSLTGGGPIVWTPFANLTGGASGAGPFTPQGVDNYDPAATEGYFIGVDNATFGTLMIRRVSTPGGTPTLSANLPLAVSTTYYPFTVPHLGNTGGTNGYLDALDDRLFAAHIRNGRLWTAHNINVNASGVASSTSSRDAVRWYELQNLNTTPAIVQSGTIFDPAATNPLYRWIPSIMVSGQGHVAVGFSTAGATSRADATTVGRFAGDTLGTMQTPITYTASTFAYNPPGDPGGTSGRRWGDFSYTSLDPCDDMTMWTIQEFTNATNSYGVRAVKLIAPPPATPSSASPTVVLWGSSSVTVTITGTVVSGSGFYDTPSTLTDACRLRLAASVSGGVTVNSVTYINPTLIQMNISTVGASTGLQNVTITNPDGQSIVGSNMIKIVASHDYADPAVACSGNVPCFSTVQAALNALADGGLATAYGTHTIAATLISDNAGANNVTIDGVGTLNWTGGVGALFTIGNGNVTVKGITLTNASTVFNQTGAGTLTAYANNIYTFTTAYAGAGTPGIGHNYWGTTNPTAPVPTGMPPAEWLQRLGAPRVTWAEGVGSASLISATLGGGTGTAVIVSMGRAAAPANAPFGNGVAGHVNQMCSDFYDYFTVGGGGTWTLNTPVDNNGACNLQTLAADRLFRITSLASCSPAGNTLCWSLTTPVTHTGQNLVASNLTVAALGGTHFVAGDNVGTDPTAITVRSLAAQSSDFTLPIGLIVFVGLVGVLALWQVRKRQRAH